MTEKAKSSNGHKELIRVEHLKKYFPVRGGLLKRVMAWVQAVDDVSFKVFPGETLGLVGESGCGKTTILNLIAGFLQPNSGEVLIE